MAYTNKTANYELPQYVPTDQPTYLEDFNGAMFTIDSGMAENSSNIGDLSTLTTTAKSNLVSAVNEVNQNSGVALIGDLSTLTTTEKSTVVGAINEVDYNTDTNTTAIGTLSSLTTTVKTDLVSAINEVDGNTDTNSTSIGDLSTLTTTVKTDLVSAINEIASSSGGSCKLHLLDITNYSRTNPIILEDLELGSYLLYYTNTNTSSPKSIYIKNKSTDSNSTFSMYTGAILNYYKTIESASSTSDSIGNIQSFYTTSTGLPYMYVYDLRCGNMSNRYLYIFGAGYNLITNNNRSDIGLNYNSSAIQYLKNVNGSINWVTEPNIADSVIYMGKINTYNSSANALDLTSYPAQTKIILKHHDSTRSFFLKVGSYTAEIPVTTNDDEAILNNTYYVDINSISGTTVKVSVVWASTYEFGTIVTNMVPVNFTSTGATVTATTRNIQGYTTFQIEEDSSGNLTTATLQKYINIAQTSFAKKQAPQRAMVQYVDKDKNNFILSYKSHIADTQQILEGTGILKTASANGLYEAYRITLEINYTSGTYTSYNVTKTSLGYILNPSAISGYSATGTKTLGLNNGALEWV